MSKEIKVRSLTTEEAREYGCKYCAVGKHDKKGYYCLNAKCPYAEGVKELREKKLL